MVSLGLDLFDTTDLLAMQHEMRELVRAIEPGTSAIVLVGAQDYDRVVSEGQGKRFDDRIIEREPDHGDPVCLQQFDNFRGRIGRNSPQRPNLGRGLLNLGGRGLQPTHGKRRHVTQSEPPCVRRTR